jgi:hypothetical protein
MTNSIAGSIVWATLALLTYSVVALMRRQVRRAARRNRDGACGLCGAPFLESDRPDYVEAIRACGPCVRRMRRRNKVAVTFLGVVCGFVLLIGAGLTVDVIRKHGEGWGTAAFALGVGGGFVWFLVVLLHRQSAANAALRARDLKLTSGQPFDGS